jgi:trimeric autotransporter adhesin
VVVNASGQLGVKSFSRRYKEDIRSRGDVSDRLLKLRPVPNRYKKADENGQKPEQYGLVAEEAAQVMPELVVYNQKGQPETVAYQTLAPLLVNALQGEHKVVAAQAQELAAMKSQIVDVNELRAELARLRQSIAGLTATQ